MSSAAKYIIYLGVLHVGLAVMAYFLLGEDKWLLLLVELMVMLSAWIAYKIFRSLISPVRLPHQRARTSFAPASPP